MRKAKPGNIRTSFELSATAVNLADKIAHDANLNSRKEAVERAIMFYGQAAEAIRQGLRLVVVDPDGKQVEMPLDTPVVASRAPERLVVPRVGSQTVRRLVAVADTPHHPAANVALRLAMAASHPDGPQPVAVSLLFQLIYWAIRINDSDFLSLVRDVVATTVTNCDSFAHLLTMEHEIPSFDGNFFEHQFLSDEYFTEKRRLLKA